MVAIRKTGKILLIDDFMCCLMLRIPFPHAPDSDRGCDSSIAMMQGQTINPLPLEKVAAMPQSIDPAKAIRFCFRKEKRMHDANVSATTITF